MVWLFVHLMYLVQFQSRLIVFVQWGIQFVTFSRGAWADSVDYRATTLRRSSFNLGREAEQERRQIPRQHGACRDAYFRQPGH